MFPFWITELTVTVFIWELVMLWLAYLAVKTMYSSNRFRDASHYCCTWLLPKDMPVEGLKYITTQLSYHLALCSVFIITPMGYNLHQIFFSCLCIINIFSAVVYDSSSLNLKSSVKRFSLVRMYTGHRGVKLRTFCRYFYTF
jgi:hypothetical protein